MFDFWSLIPHSIIWSGIFAMILGATISFIAIPVIVRVAKAKSLTDKPNARSSHVQSIPSLGGIAIFAGVLLGATLLVPPSFMDQTLIYTVAATFILFLVGQKDDIVGISWKKKLIAQVIASLIMIIMGDLRFTTLYGLFGVDDIPMWLSVPLSLFIYVAIINAFNLIDGIDGLASGTGIMTSFVMGVWMYGIGSYSMAILAWSLTGSLLPFFYFNVFGKKHKLFMGDTGSLIIGMLMAVFAAEICGREILATYILHFDAAPFILISILLYPLYDMTRVVVIRLASGKSPFQADRNHIHHMFLDAGFSHRRSTFYILIISAMAICWTLVFRNATQWFIGGSLLFWALLSTYVVKLIGRRTR